MTEYILENKFSRIWTPVQSIGSPCPLCWVDLMNGDVMENPEYIAPALRSEPAQYEQALVDYELCEKAR